MIAVPSPALEREAPGLLHGQSLCPLPAQLAVLWVMPLVDWHPTHERDVLAFNALVFVAGQGLSLQVVEGVHHLHERALLRFTQLLFQLGNS